MSANRLAQLLAVPATASPRSLRASRGHGETALRLSRAFDTTPEFWLNLQQAYELRLAEKALGPG